MRKLERMETHMEIYVPSGKNEQEALMRTTHLAIAAHHDDIEIMAYDGILRCFGQPGKWFTGAVVTNGSGSPRSGIYADCSDEDMMAIRKEEQKKVLEELEKRTYNEFAGTISIVEGNSGLQLYNHQQDAIRNMNQKILNKESYSGLLVLPTGGGKTLTATYWLMSNILDYDQKIIWLAHRHELLNQARAGFEKVCYSDIARHKQEFNYRIISGQHDMPVHIKETDDVIIGRTGDVYDALTNRPIGSLTAPSTVGVKR